MTEEATARRRGRGPDTLLAAVSEQLEGSVADPAAVVRTILQAVRRKAVPAKLGEALLERLLPPLARAAPRPIVRLDLPPVRDVKECDTAHELVLQAMCAGELTPAEARMVQQVIEQRFEARQRLRRHGWG